jgi:SAM-dependent methyltransferase/uncharacterized protein YbaR (Trm112 family)
MHELKISGATQKLLRCPKCRSKLDLDVQPFICVNPACGAHYPVVDGVPILINESASVFTINDFILGHNTPLNPQRSQFSGFIPQLGTNIKTQRNYQSLSDLLLSKSSFPRVLVIGGSILGKGMQPLVQNRSLELIETDVSLGTRTQLVCDAHDIPFDDKSFDGVIAQAVLEHVVDPYRCVEEIHRVLKENGLVYAETPFMQQVHLGRYDFTRFTHLGHRRLFRKFDELESGTVGGPGTALAWAYQYFLLSFTNTRLLRKLLKGFARLTSFYLKYFDYYFDDKAAALDAASGFYFLGQKSDSCLSDRELITLYKGSQ